jgi:hypothetical protein
VTITAIPDLPTLDVGTLSAGQRAAVAASFDALARLSLLPFNEVAADAARAELDRRVLGEILGLKCAASAELQLLRRKLSEEPSIAGAKRRRGAAMMPVKVRRAPPPPVQAEAMRKRGRGRR